MVTEYRSKAAVTFGAVLLAGLGLWRCWQPSSDLSASAGDHALPTLLGEPLPAGGSQDAANAAPTPSDPNNSLLLAHSHALDADPAPSHNTLRSFQSGALENNSPNDDDAAGALRPLKKLPPELYQDRRIQLNPNETVEIILPRHLITGSLPVTIRSEDGGVVDGRDLTPEMTFESGHIPESFRYTVGRHRGLYVVSIYYGQEIQRLEFWAGEPLPLGKPGPSRNITPPEVNE